jgi:restriction system protein
MIWVIRAGIESIYLPKFMNSGRIFLPWEGYKINFNGLETREDFKQLVIKEKGNQSRTTIANWAGMLFSFTKEMNVGDEVLVPARHSQTYCLANIIGEYEFNISDEDGLYHSRRIEVNTSDIPRNIFSQQVIYSLGAFRTIFRVKYEDEIVASITKWSKGVSR